MKQQLNFEEIDEFNKTLINSIDFTKRSINAFYDTVDLADFIEKDADVIFNFLKKRIRLIPFGDYLKRYIFIKTGMRGVYNDIDIKVYQRIIIDSFHENSTPKSFNETTSKISALSKNWLSQASANRSTVFLLGFGLNMNQDDVSEFLTKVLRERDFNYKNPIEVIYWYCFREGYKYPKVLELMERHVESQCFEDLDLLKGGTIGAREIAYEISDDNDLLRYLAKLKSDNHTGMYSVTAYKWFSDLYLKCKCIIAEFYTADEQEKRSSRVWSSDNITESDVEKVICCGMPFNQSGNLEKFSASRLAECFINKRLSRKRIAELQTKAVLVDRFDLITLNFFLFSQDEKYISDRKNRFIAFVDRTDEILAECMMGELYLTNPYECFITMCILSDCPLATYSDVLEISYNK